MSLETHLFAIQHPSLSQRTEQSLCTKKVNRKSIPLFTFAVLLKVLLQYISSDALRKATMRHFNIAPSTHEDTHSN